MNAIVKRLVAVDRLEIRILVDNAIDMLSSVKPSSETAVTELRALGLTPILLTGDNERAARAIAGLQAGGKPVENAYIESFNGKFRDECLNEH